MIALGGAAFFIVIVAAAALYIGGVFNGASSSKAPRTGKPLASQLNTPTVTSRSTAPAATGSTPPATTSTPTTTPAPPPSPAQVIRTHLEDLNSGNYAGAFKLMTSTYRSQNPSWPSDRTAADPGINIISIGAPQYAPGAANVVVDFFARDRHPSPGSDTQCREFQGTVHLVKQSGAWRYDPPGDNLTATVSNSNINCP